ncbi:MAG: hypothetical protein SFU21_07235 [Flavihumibacter sp.]|nr:hypothetical protein [Flavihumibacter sp.]
MEIIYNDPLVHGFTKVTELEEGLLIKLIHTNFTDNFEIKRGTLKEGYCTLHFIFLSNAKGASLGINDNFYTLDTNQFNIAFLTYADEQITFSGAKGTEFKSLIITMHKTWLQKNLPDIFSGAEGFFMYSQKKENRIWLSMEKYPQKQQVQSAFEIQDGPFFKPVMQKLSSFLVSSFFMHAHQQYTDKLKVEASR